MIILNENKLNIEDWGLAPIPNPYFFDIYEIKNRLTIFC